MGQPVHWAGGQVNYYVDQGALNSQVTNQQARAMVGRGGGAVERGANGRSDTDGQRPSKRRRERDEYRGGERHDHAAGGM